LDFMF